MHIKRVPAGHFSQSKADDLIVCIQDAALQAQTLKSGKGADDGVVLVADALVQALGVFLGPQVQHIQAARDQLAAERDEVPILFRLEAVAVILFPVERLARIGGELFGGIDVVRQALFQGEGKLARESLFQLLTVVFGHTAQKKGIPPFIAEGLQGLNGGLQGAGTDGKDEGALAFVAQLGDHPVLKAADQLFIILVPDVDVAEVVVGAGTVLRHDDGIDPGLVAEGDGFKLKR